ncbi:Diacylglycerol O-acyltransferase [Dirofilaria immitis]
MSLLCISLLRFWLLAFNNSSQNNNYKILCNWCGMLLKFCRTPLYMDEKVKDAPINTPIIYFQLSRSSSTAIMIA